MRKTTSGSSIARARLKPVSCTPAQILRSPNAVKQHHQFFNSIRKATSSQVGAAREKASTGRIPIMESQSITKVTYGSAEMASANRQEPHEANDPHPARSKTKNNLPDS